MDFRTDNNTFGIDFVKKSLGSKIPSYVKVANDNMEGHKSSSFADEVKKEYPINTKDNTWKSIAYFYSQGKSNMDKDKAKDIEQSLQIAALIHGIKEDAKDIIKALNKVSKPKIQKKASQEFAIVKESYGYLPINNELEVMESARKLDNDYLKLEPVLAKTAAENIVKKAEEFGIANKAFIPEFILDKGTQRLFNVDFAKKIASDRAKKSGCNLYIDIIDAAWNEYKTTGGDLTKYARQFYKLDKAFKLNDYSEYGNQDPCAVFYSGLEKKSAEEFSSKNVLLNGVFIPVEEFKTDSFKENVQNYFSKKIASQIIKACDKKDTIDIKIALDALDSQIRFDLLKIMSA